MSAVVGSIRRRSASTGVGFGASATFINQYGPMNQMQKVGRVAIWNLQWQVKGFVDARPNIDSRTLSGRFVDGSDVEGVDLNASVVRTTWQSLDQQTCRLFLMSIVALYEAWCFDFSRTFEHFGNISAAKQRSMQDALQWPDSYQGTTKTGILAAIQELESSTVASPGMAVFVAPWQSAPVDTTTFSARMRVYRLFKEARNSIAHSGALVTDRVCSAFTEYTSITASELGMRVVPIFPEPTVGEPITLSWKGVIGLADMLRRLVIDVDHCLMHTRTAAHDLAERLRVDPTGYGDPTWATSAIKSRTWAKNPNGPYIVVGGDHLGSAQGAVARAVWHLLKIPGFSRKALLPIWPELIEMGAVEVRSNLRDL